MNDQQIRIEHMHNQLLAGLDDHLDEMNRIYQDGVTSDRDELIVQMALSFVLGLLHSRRGDAELMQIQSVE